MTEVVRQSHSWYPQDPNLKTARNDPTYFDAVGDLLTDRKYQVVHLEEELGGDPWIVHEAVECWRDHGMRIEGGRGKVGYRFVGVQRPKTWRRWEALIVKYGRAIFLRPKPKPAAEPSQQLTIPRKFMPVQRRAS